MVFRLPIVYLTLTAYRKYCHRRGSMQPRSVQSRWTRTAPTTQDMMQHDTSRGAVLFLAVAAINAARLRSIHSFLHFIVARAVQSLCIPARHRKTVVTTFLIKNQCAIGLRKTVLENHCQTAAAITFVQVTCSAVILRTSSKC